MLDAGINRMRYTKEAVIHCIEIMGLKNPERLEITEQGGYIHTNTRGRKRLFTPYSCSVYFANCKKDIEFRNKKLHKVMTYYIVEETVTP